jgi:hypothetical protein
MKKSTVGIVVALGFIFSACNPSSQEFMAEKTAVHQHSKTMKPGAPVRLASTLPIYLSPNEVKQADILLDVQQAANTVTVDISNSRELDLSGTQLHQEFSSITSQAIKIPVQIRALTNGRFYVNVTVVFQGEEGESRRFLSSIVQVGESSPSSNKVQKTAGEKFIVLPAGETITHE